MKKKTKKIMAGIFGVLLILFLLTFVNSFMGNPLSKFMAGRASDKYIASNYGDMDLEMTKSFYNFKDGKYAVIYQDKHSVDTVFAVYCDSFGHVVRDDYEGEVLSHLTTFRRIDGELRDYGEKLFREKLPEYEIDLAHLSLDISDGDGETKSTLGRLVPDMELDIHDPPASVEANLWIYEDELSFETMAEAFIKIKDICENENIPVSRFGVRIQLRDEKKDQPNNIWLYDIEPELIEKENLPEILRQMYSEGQK